MCFAFAQLMDNILKYHFEKTLIVTTNLFLVNRIFTFLLVFYFQTTHAIEMHERKLSACDLVKCSLKEAMVLLLAFCNYLNVSGFQSRQSVLVPYTQIFVKFNVSHSPFQDWLNTWVISMSLIQIYVLPFPLYFGRAFPSSSQEERITTSQQARLRHSLESL